MTTPNLPAVIADRPIASPPTLILFGRDGAGKPRAAWFDASDAEAAANVAGTMQLRSLPLTEAGQRALAKQFARGRMLPSGRAHVPLAKHELYDRLVCMTCLASNRQRLSYRTPRVGGHAPRLFRRQLILAGA